MFRKIILALSACAGLAIPVFASQNAHTDLYVVMFRADWCGPCKIVEPNLSSALHKLSDPSIEYITFD